MHLNTKVRLQMKLSKKIYQTHTTIINELKQLFNNYKYNPDKKKHKKHFPASFNILYEKAINNKSMNLSISLSSKKIEEQIIELLNTAFRRYNMSVLFNNETGISHIYNNLGIANIITIIDIKDYLIKYEESEVPSQEARFALITISFSKEQDVRFWASQRFT